MFFNLYLSKALDVLIAGTVTVDKMDRNCLFLELQSSGGAIQEAKHHKYSAGYKDDKQDAVIEAKLCVLVEPFCHWNSLIASSVEGASGSDPHLAF